MFCLFLSELSCNVERQVWLRGAEEKEQLNTINITTATPKA